MNIFKKLFSKRKDSFNKIIYDITKIEPVVKKRKELPKGWYVYELGQNPLHMLWHCLVVNLDNLNIYISTEEHDTKEEALMICINKVIKYENKLKEDDSKNNI